MSSFDNIMFIDVETIGLPITKGYNKYHNPEETQYYDSSRIVEIAYVICTYSGKIIKKYSELIIPESFVIENSNIHGITNEEAKNKGKNIKDVLKEMCHDLDNVNMIIAHNINFDIYNILSECCRIKYDEMIQKINSKSKQCTMVMGKNLMYKQSQFSKNPKLTELYQYIFNQSIKQEHRALSDVMMCLECYFEIALQK